VQFFRGDIRENGLGNTSEHTHPIGAIVRDVDPAMVSATFYPGGRLSATRGNGRRGCDCNIPEKLPSCVHAL
jgi:hypothetical protein